MSSVKVGSDDSVRVPKLEVGGGNWVLYKARLVWAADAKGVAGHLDGTSKEPAAPSGSAGTGSSAATSATTSASTTRPRSASTGGTTAAAVGGTPDPAAQAKYETSLAEWRKGEANVKQLIASTIPDSLFIKIRDLPTAHQIWTAIAKEFERKSRMVSVDLRRQLQDTRCDEKDDVRKHLTTLTDMRERLAAMGQPLSDED
ncbi:hypothetical protein K466DRAFT_507961, partial [Polyporus arcularius HHB13444]